MSATISLAPSVVHLLPLRCHCHRGRETFRLGSRGVLLGRPNAVPRAGGTVNVSAHERNALDCISEGLSASDPVLAGFLDTFTRLNAGERMSAREQVEPRPHAMHSRPGMTSRLAACTPTRPARRPSLDQSALAGAVAGFADLSGRRCRLRFYRTVHRAAVDGLPTRPRTVGCRSSGPVMTGVPRRRCARVASVLTTGRCAAAAVSGQPDRWRPERTAAGSLRMGE
jgi:hypothetical protein